VRQLINAIERAKIMADDGIVRVRDLPREVVQYGTDRTEPLRTRTDDLSSIEKAKVVEVLRRERGNKTRAACALGIDRRKLYRLIQKYHVTDSDLAQRGPAKRDYP
jgi:transcriptional regulator of acetoin/glycerol metabolism